MIFSRLTKNCFIFMQCFLLAVVNGRNFVRNEAVLQNLLNDDIYFGGEHENEQPEVRKKDLPKNGELFEGDIVMDNGLRRFVLGLNTKRSAVILAEEGKARHWKDGIVPYIFDESTLPIIKRRIHQAIEYFHDYTCIKYVPRSNEKDYVKFTSAGKSGCSSSVGRQGGEQRIHLSKHCSRTGTVMHEMMHGIGILHEQSRPDRDDHVKVRFENIKPKLIHNFRKYDWYTATNLDVPYNFNSVMHYSNIAFTKNGDPTLSSRKDPELKFGQREFITKSDALQINNLYPCKNVDYDKNLLVDDMTDEVILKEKRERQEEEEEEKEVANEIFANVIQQNF